MPYITAAQGTSAHTIAARNEDWDIAFKLLEESSRGPVELLAECNRSSGETLLHYFAQRGTSRLNAVKALMGKCKELEGKGWPGAVRSVLLAKDMQGYCAYSLVNNEQMSLSFSLPGPPLCSPLLQAPSSGAVTRFEAVAGLTC
jgi:hypothetical protein